MNNQFVQKTLVMIKPDGMRRNLAGEIMARFQKTGLTIADCKLVVADEKLASAHYPETEEWLSKVGQNALNDCEKYGLDPIKTIGTNDPVEFGRKILNFNKEYLMEGPMLAIVFEGNHAIEVVRKLIGHTLPVLSAPGTIRGDLCTESAIVANLEKRSLYNLVHASGTPEEAEREIELWFGK